MAVSQLPDRPAISMKVLFAKWQQRRLGLLASRGRVEMMGGMFDVQSAPGKGITISAEIPIKGNTANAYLKVSGKATGKVK